MKKLEVMSDIDDWLYELKNSHKHPDEFSKISKEKSLKYYRDLKNSLDTAKDERSLEIAKLMLAEGDPIEKIHRITGISVEQIENLKKTE